ncbi:TetR/AcrR family transcriptional regulator [Streptomyces sp. NPDC048663]|uniref:TetR/AcrR family transcriptional regulator n=1 Tax=Streptomyces sp. NPDC048663 TaxID=3155638 RepID=UPI00341C3769
MYHYRAQRAASREGVLRIAARKVRTDGISGIGIADLMREARLTHGGFYKHFASRDDLSPQAAVALAEGSVKMSGPRGRTTRTRGPASSTRTSPSSTRHTRHRLRTGPPGRGRGGDGTEGDLHLEEAYERQVRAYLDLIAGLDHTPGRVHDGCHRPPRRTRAPSVAGRCPLVFARLVLVLGRDPAGHVVPAPAVLLAPHPFVVADTADLEAPCEILPVVRRDVGGTG